MTNVDDLLCPDCDPKKPRLRIKRAKGAVPRFDEPWQALCDEIEEAYDKLAKDNPVWYPSEQFVRLFTGSVGDITELEKPRILDVGCGSGFWEWMLARYGPADFEVEAFDISPASIHLAKQKCGDPRVKFWVGNLYCHRCVRQVIKGSFDRIWMFEVLQHIPEEYWVSVLSSYFGWLHPGGSFILIDKDARHPASQENLKIYRENKDVASFFGTVQNYIDIEKLGEMFSEISGHEEIFVNQIDDWFAMKVVK